MNINSRSRPLAGAAPKSGAHQGTEDHHTTATDSGPGPLFKAPPPSSRRITYPGVTVEELRARRDQLGLVLALLAAGPLTDDVARGHGVRHLASRISELRNNFDEPIEVDYRRETTPTGRRVKLAVYRHATITPRAPGSSG